jgi:hypothetical protein
MKYELNYNNLMRGTRWNPHQTPTPKFGDGSIPKKPNLSIKC